MRKRIFTILIGISFLFSVIFIRLGVIQLINGKSLQDKALSQWTRDLPITAERGKIYDSKGATLAVSYTTYNVYVRNREVKDAHAVALFLSKNLNMSFDNVYQKVMIKGVSEVLIKMQISAELGSTILNADYDGIFLSENNKRYYPYGDLLTQILGFTTVDNMGQAGVEAYFNDFLTGENGYYMVQSDIQGKELDNSLRTYTNPIPGNNITLTIDVNIQLILEKTLVKIMEEQKAKSVTAVMMNPKTGEILASSTKPSYDLNNVPRDNVTELMEQVKNKAVVDVYEPGSTFKILTMSSALEAGVAKLTDRFFCPGYRMVDGQRIKCWRTIGHGSIDLTEGLMNSCNCVFMDIAQRLGTDTFYNYLKSFGIGQKTGITVSGESSGIMMKASSVKTVDLVRIGFGQAIAVTPMQLITAVSSAINGGIKISPSLIKSIDSFDNKNVKTYSNGLGQNVIKSSTSNEINEMMKRVVNKDVPFSFIEGYDMGGKTGTAQKYQNGVIAQGKYVSSFIGTYPASNPEYLLLLLVDEPGAGAYYGSVVASPYGKMIFSDIFNLYNIKPDDSSFVPEPKDIKMPYLIGKSLYEATKTLIEMGLSYEIQGDGGFILNQFPPAGTMIDKCENILLIT